MSRRWLLVAAEKLEFDGILKRFGGFKKIEWPAQFAAEAEGNGDRWVMIANGPGTRLVGMALEKKIDVDGVISTGFCGALDPALKVGDIVRTPWHPATEFASRDREGAVARLCCIDRVAVTAREKKNLREATRADAVDMESEAVQRIAGEWGVPYRAIRVVSDTAADDMPLDFNLYRDADGRFSRQRIARAAMMRPFTAVPALLRLDRNCRMAAESLGNFFADSRL